MNKTTTGFTIIELLITIVVVAILAAISVVAYNGIQNRAHDAAVRHDLTNLGKKIEIYKISHPSGQYPPPANDAALASLQAKVSTHAYSRGFVTPEGGHNLLYCRAANDEQFALIAWSKSGNGFVFTNGSIRPFEHQPASLVTSCPNAGISDGWRDWIYRRGAWRI